MSTATRAEICIVACAEAFRGDGEILASPMGLIPSLGARLARATFEPDLLLTDGVASLVRRSRTGEGDTVEGGMPYRKVFDVVWSGRRHVMMGASQIDRFGNQNISCIGPHEEPKVQLLGARGAPGNTINHPTSYWVPRHSKRVFVEQVDFVSGVGYDRAAKLGSAGRFHEIRRVVSNLGVFDFQTAKRSMRIASLHPGVDLEEVLQLTDFDLHHDEEVATTRAPTAEELLIIRDVLDPKRRSQNEVAA
jgi:acyl CoA:acetate/3-ketoacid CoA transferase beta subunit